MTDAQFLGLALFISLLGGLAIVYWNTQRVRHRRGRRRQRRRRGHHSHAPESPAHAEIAAAGEQRRVS